VIGGHPKHATSEFTRLMASLSPMMSGATSLTEVPPPSEPAYPAPWSLNDSDYEDPPPVYSTQAPPSANGDLAEQLHAIPSGADSIAQFPEAAAVDIHPNPPAQETLSNAPTVVRIFPNYPAARAPYVPYHPVPQAPGNAHGSQFSANIDWSYFDPLEIVGYGVVLTFLGISFFRGVRNWWRGRQEEGRQRRAFKKWQDEGKLPRDMHFTFVKPEDLEHASNQRHLDILLELLRAKTGTRRLNARLHPRQWKMVNLDT
jgi:hypothetical protein